VLVRVADVFDGAWCWLGEVGVTHCITTWRSHSARSELGPQTCVGLGPRRTFHSSVCWGVAANVTVKYISMTMWNGYLFKPSENMSHSTAGNVTWACFGTNRSLYGDTSDNTTGFLSHRLRPWNKLSSSQDSVLLCSLGDENPRKHWRPTSNGFIRLLTLRHGRREVYFTDLPIVNLSMRCWQQPISWLLGHGFAVPGLHCGIQVWRCRCRPHLTQPCSHNGRCRQSQLHVRLSMAALAFHEVSVNEVSAKHVSTLQIKCKIQMLTIV